MKQLILALAALSSFTFAAAVELSPEQAIARLSRKQVTSLSRSQAPLEHIATLPQLYIFSSGKGYAVLPADDCAPALLGYSENSNFNPAENPSLAYWLGEYSRLIHYAALHGYQLQDAANTPTGTIAPLVPTFWNQEAPYNLYCPLKNGHRTVTGCVATAMAQVMRYYSYPEKGNGSHSYNWNDTTLTFNYAENPFNWDDMTYQYGSSSTQQQKDAVAKLMYAVGVSVNMMYGPESGAYSQSMGSALLNIFNYDKGGWMPYRDYYDLDTWIQMCYDNLAQGMPILYSGEGADGGHQFVCDGYNPGGYFHFNWGWGGMSDGYFLLTGLNPSAIGVGGGDGGFNYGQTASLGIRPPQENSSTHYLVACNGGFNAPVRKFKISDSVTFNGHFNNQSYTALPDGALGGVEIAPTSGGDTLRIPAFSIAGLPPGYNTSAMKITFPDLEPGTYTIKPVVNITGNWEPARSPVTANPMFLATVVSNDSVFLSTPDVPHLEAIDIKMASELFWGHPFSITFTATNSGQREYSGNVIPELLTSDGISVVARGVKQPFVAQSGMETPVTYIGSWTLNKAYSDSIPKPGAYALRLTDSAGAQIGDTLHVSLNTAPTGTTIQVSDVKLLSPNPVTQKDNVKFSFITKCTEGYFTGTVEMLIFNESGGEDLKSNNTDNIFLAKDQSKVCDIDFDLSDLPDGHYIAAVYHSGYKGNYVYFRIETPAAIDTVTGDTSQPEPSGIYNLQGVKLPNAETPGIYIINGRKIIVTDPGSQTTLP